MTISQDLLKRIILDQHKDQIWPSVYIQRATESRLDELGKNREIIVVTGVRRCGKSILLEYVRRNTDNGNDYFFNFEDERLVNFGTEDFEILHQTLMSMYGVQKTMFFDEIQNIPAWEIFIRRMYNSGNKIYLTGSNANLFSDELGTRLTGRYIALNIYPISFAEYSQYYFNIGQQDFSSSDIGTLRKLYSEYVEYGGIPEYIRNKDKGYLHSLYESILYRDIIARYKIANPDALKKLLFFLASNCSKLISYSRLLAMINNNGQVIKSTTTISDYCTHIEKAFLCFFVSCYSDSLSKQQKSEKKIYFIDHALARIIGFRASEDHGRMLENIVFIELKRREYEIYYFKENKECDFVVRSGMHTLQVIQVCMELYDPETKRREVSGLLEAMARFALTDGLIITENEDYMEVIDMGDKKYNILVLPIWKWLRSINKA